MSVSSRHLEIRSRLPRGQETPDALSPIKHSRNEWIVAGILWMRCLYLRAVWGVHKVIGKRKENHRITYFRMAATFSLRHLERRRPCGTGLRTLAARCPIFASEPGSEETGRWRMPLPPFRPWATETSKHLANPSRCTP